jgi:hypothetical protein
MTDLPQPPPDFEGWRVLDAQGNVVASGGVTIAEMDGQLAEVLAEAARTEGEQEQ